MRTAWSGQSEMNQEITWTEEDQYLRADYLGVPGVLYKAEWLKRQNSLKVITCPLSPIQLQWLKLQEGLRLVGQEDDKSLYSSFQRQFGMFFCGVYEGEDPYSANFLKEFDERYRQTVIRMMKPLDDR